MVGDGLSLYPLYTAINAEGHLTVAGYDLAALAEQYGTPLYVYDGETIRCQVERVRALLNRYYPADSMLAYAAKAYFSLQFAEKLAALNLGVDVASLGELRVAQRAGFHAEGIHLHGNNKSEAELLAALEADIQAVVVDSLDELDFLEQLTARAGKQARIWLRITPDLPVDTHPNIRTSHAGSKFGLHIQNGEALTAVRRALASPRLRLTGLHTHLGSQLFDPESYRQAIEAIFKVAHQADFIPAEISPGGGWGVRYTDEDPDDDPQAWLQTISAAVQAACVRLDWPLPRLALEPGRMLVARAGVAIYRVGAQKVAPDGTRIVAIDGGMGDNPRVSLYQARYTARLVNCAHAPAAGSARIAGRYCESGDELIADAELPLVQRGEFLAMPVAGAYQLSMASNYNLVGRPAVLWLEGDGVELMQRRELPEQSGWWGTQR